LARVLASMKLGMAVAASIAMTTATMSNSTRVKARRCMDTDDSRNIGGIAALAMRGGWMNGRDE
jgi:hypothetical protein